MHWRIILRDQGKLNSIDLGTQFPAYKIWNKVKYLGENKMFSEKVEEYSSSQKLYRENNKYLQSVTLKNKPI